MPLTPAARQPEEFTCPRCGASKGVACRDDWGRVRNGSEPCWARVQLAEKKTRERIEKLFGKPWE